MAPDMPIGRRIQSYRIRRQLTQEIVAGRVGRSVSWLSQVERGVRSVDKWQTILELAEVLRCDPRDLVGWRMNLAPNGGVAFRALPDLRAILTAYDSIWQWDVQVEVQLPMLEKAEARALLAARFGPVQDQVEAFARGAGDAAGDNADAA